MLAGMTEPADRRYQDLLDDGLRLANADGPVLRPGSDGYAAVQAAALIADEISFRVNQIPDLLRGPLLELLDLRPTPARAATTSLEFRIAEPPTDVIDIPRGTQVTTDDGKIVFGTRHDLRIAPATVVDVDAKQDGLYVGLDAPQPGCLVEIMVPHLPTTAHWDCWVGDGWVECHADSDGLPADTVLLHVPYRHEESVMAGRTAGWLRCRSDSLQPAHPGQVSVRVVGGFGDAQHGVLVRDEPLGASTGEPDQRFTLRHRPVLANPTPVVQVGGEDGWDTWTIVPTFIDSMADDHHVVLDAQAGTLRFGPRVSEPDGTQRQRGAVPPRGALVRVLDYWSGGGAAGDVGVDELHRLSQVPGFSVRNTSPGRGAADAETVDNLWHRAPFALRARDRAVTAEDYEYLAREAAPELARVHCTVDVTGTVRVLLVPDAERHEFGQVTAAGLLVPEDVRSRVADHLDERRVIGTRLSVGPAGYRGVTVRTTVRRTRGSNARQVRSAALRALYEYLDPIVGGPDGSGWPFGRTVHIGDIFAVLQRVEGVDRVEDAKIFGTTPDIRGRGEPVTRLGVAPGALAYSVDHQVTVEQW
jgi:predicted phage baseplate assembly protein